MRKSIVKFIQPIIVLCLLCLLISLTAYVLRRNESYTKNHDFYNDSTPCDVFFLGSSHTVMGILPMELWNDYGITSYNLANNGQWCAGDYWVLKNALDHKTPSLVVLDAYAVFADEKHAEGHMDYLHESLDPIPLSLTKVEAIRDMFAEENQAEFIFPFTTYHNRWESIDSSYFQRTPSYQKGAYENASTKRPVVIPSDAIPLLPISQSNENETISKAYLRSSIELCQERGIPVLLMVTPFNASNDLQEWVNSVYGIAEAYDIPFINGLRENIIDTHCDLWDDGHLNSSGARKWTSYMGNYIMEHYELTDKRTDDSCAKWNDDYRAYRLYEASQLQETENLHSFLMLLHDSTFQYCITLSEDASVYEDDTFWQLLANTGAAISKVDDTSGHFFTVDHGFSTTSIYSSNNTVTDLPTSYGTISYVPTSTGVRLTLDGIPETYWENPANPDWDVQILVFDPTTGAIISRCW